MLLRWLRRLERDERGQMAIVMVFSLLVVLMFFGLAFDGGLWYFDHRTAQNQADSAALAGALELQIQGEAGASSAAATSAAQSKASEWLNKNGVANPSAQACSYGWGWFRTDDTDSNNYPDKVTICLRRQATSIFSTLANIGGASVSAQAVAIVEEIPVRYAIMAMDTPSSSCSSGSTRVLTLEGNVKVTIDGGATYSASCFRVNGNSSELTSTGNDVVTGTRGNMSNVSPPPTTGISPVPDPFAGLTPPTISGSCVSGSTNFNSGTRTLSPGRYCSELRVTGSAKVTLQPGVYILERGMTINGNFSGYFRSNGGVLFYDTCSPSPCSGSGAKAADIRVEGDANIDLTGHASYQHILFWIDRLSGTSSSKTQLTLRGGSNVTLKGNIYAISSDVILNGTSCTSDDSDCDDEEEEDGGVLNLSIVADTVTLGGDGTLNLKWDATYAPKIKQLALVE